METLPLDRASLIDAQAAGRAFEFLFFFGHSGQGVSRQCLSQWYEAPFEVDGIRFRTAEHFMMFKKAALFADDEMRDAIVAAETPGAAKALGRKVRGFDQAEWEANRLAVVTAGSVAKFGQNPELRAFLLATATKVLVEAAPRDRIWGIGMSAKNPAATDARSWRGLNLLGFALMAARAQLMA